MWISVALRGKVTSVHLDPLVQPSLVLCALPQRSMGRWDSTHLALSGKMSHDQGASLLCVEAELGSVRAWRAGDCAAKTTCQETQSELHYFSGAMGGRVALQLGENTPFLNNQSLRSNVVVHQRSRVLLRGRVRIQVAAHRKVEQNYASIAQLQGELELLGPSLIPQLPQHQH